MSGEAMLTTALGIMGTVVTTLAAAVVALWRMQVAAADKCEQERRECEGEQVKLRDKIEALWKVLFDMRGITCTVSGCSQRTISNAGTHLGPEAKQ